MSDIERTLAYYDASNEGIRARLGLPYRVQFLSASDEVLRDFPVGISASPSLGGLLELIPKPVMSLGPRGELAYARLLASDGEVLIKGSIGLSEQHEAASTSDRKRPWVLLNLTTLLVAKDQPIEMVSLLIGKTDGQGSN